MNTNTTLMLLAMAAGAMMLAGDAYAQTYKDNTERIKALLENTGDIKTMLGNLTGSISSITDPLTDQIESILLSIASVNNEVADVKSSISTFASSFLTIQATVETNNLLLKDIQAQLVDMDLSIEAMQSVLGNQDDSALNTRLSQIENDIRSNNLLVNQQLKEIKDSLSRLESKEQPTTPVGPPATGLSRQTLVTEVTGYDYKSGNTRTLSGKTVYTLNMQFSCDGPVSIDTVSTNVRTPQTPMIPLRDPNSATDENYLKVENRELYHSKYELSTNNFQVLNREVEFNLQSLSTGSTLRLTSQQFESSNIIADSTSAASNLRYRITVEYLASSTVTCNLDTGRQAPSGTLSDATPLLFGINTSPSGNILKPFSHTLNCGKNPVEITSLRATVAEGWLPNLQSSTNFRLSFPGSSQSDISIGFAAGGTLNDVTYPISFSNSDMIISGNLVADGNMLVEMAYKTVSGGSCVP